LKLKRVGIYVMISIPVVAFVIKAPAVIFLAVAVSIILQVCGALAYLIVLPEEWDASFNKALPILKKGEYVPEEYLPCINSVLKAAALTYFAGALADILNLGRWLAILLRR